MNGISSGKDGWMKTGLDVISDFLGAISVTAKLREMKERGK